MASIGVVLSGCGVMDGSEIYETVLTLRELSLRGIDYMCMAPRGVHRHVINHVLGEEIDQQRDILVESSRLSRGVIEDVDDVEVRDVAGLLFPGGYGAAKNLSTFHFDGVDCQVLPEVERLVLDVYEAGKPIGAMCIAPALIAKILEGRGVKLTLGMDDAMMKALQDMGHEPVSCDFDEICVDEEHKIVTTPAYMVAQSIREADKGISALVSAFLNLI